MKLTATQLRRIIKEEVQKSLNTPILRKNSLHEAIEQSFVIHIEDISQWADTSFMEIDELIDVIRQIGAKYNLILKNPKKRAGVFSPGYSRANDVFNAVGSRSDLEAFARELDEELMGVSSEEAGEDSFLNEIIPLQSQTLGLN